MFTDLEDDSLPCKLHALAVNKTIIGRMYFPAPSKWYADTSCSSAASVCSSWKTTLVWNNTESQIYVILLIKQLLLLKYKFKLFSLYVNRTASVWNRDLHGNGDGGNIAVTTVIPRIFPVNLAVIPRGWSHLLRGYRGNGTFACGITVVVNVCYL